MQYIHVAAAVIERDGKILIARRKPEKKFGGKWEFPGGKVEDGETLKECLKRELREEMNIEVSIRELITENTYVSKEYDTTITLFALRTTYLSGEFLLNDHDQIEWVTPTEFINYEFAEADIPIVEKLIALS